MSTISSQYLTTARYTVQNTFFLYYIFFLSLVFSIRCNLCSLERQGGRNLIIIYQPYCLACFNKQDCLVRGEELDIETVNEERYIKYLSHFPLMSGSIFLFIFLYFINLNILKLLYLFGVIVALLVASYVCPNLNGYYILYNLNEYYILYK